MKKINILFVLFTICFSAFSQAPAIQWEQSYGGSNTDEAYIIKQTKDGGYIVAGWTASSDSEVTNYHGGDSDFWVVKLNSTGVLQWQNTYGGTGDDQANAIQQTIDGGYIVVGNTNSSDGEVTGDHIDTSGFSIVNSVDYWVVKLDSSGNIQWEKALGGNNSDQANSVQQTSDGGYIVAGYSYSIDGDVTGQHGSDSTSDYWIVKLDTSGAIQWEKCFGGIEDDQANAIQQTTDGGYIVAGYSNSYDGDVTGNHGEGDYWVVKLDTVGNLLWQKCLGGSGGDQAFAIQEVSGGYIIAGESSSNDGDVTGNHLDTVAYGPPLTSFDDWLVKIDVSGNIIWQKSLGGSGDEAANGVQQTYDGGFIVTGVTTSSDGDVTGYHGGVDYWVVRLDTSGSLKWELPLGGTGYDFGYSICQTGDEGYITAGLSSSIDDEVTGNHGNNDFWVVKLSPYPSCTTQIKNSLSPIHLYPNPNKGSFTLQTSNSIGSDYTISDMLGHVILQQVIGLDNETIELPDAAEGVYTLALKGAEPIRFVVLR